MKGKIKIIILKLIKLSNNTKKFILSQMLKKKPIIIYRMKFRQSNNFKINFKFYNNNNNNLKMIFNKHKI